MTKGTRMTREEFFEGYAARSGTRVAKLEARGCRVAACECDYEGCQGWQVVSEYALTSEELSEHAGLIVAGAERALTDAEGLRFAELEGRMSKTRERL